MTFPSIVKLLKTSKNLVWALELRALWSRHVLIRARHLENALRLLIGVFEGMDAFRLLSGVWAKAEGRSGGRQAIYAESRTTESGRVPQLYADYLSCFGGSIRPLAAFRFDSLIDPAKLGGTENPWRYPLPATSP